MCGRRGRVRICESRDSQMSLKNTFHGSKRSRYEPKEKSNKESFLPMSLVLQIKTVYSRLRVHLVPGQTLYKSSNK